MTYTLFPTILLDNPPLTERQIHSQWRETPSKAISESITRLNKWGRGLSSGEAVTDWEEVKIQSDKLGCRPLGRRWRGGCRRRGRRRSQCCRSCPRAGPDRCRRLSIRFSPVLPLLSRHGWVLEDFKKPARINLVDRIVPSIGIPVVPIPRRVRRNEPPEPAVVVAVPHQHQTRVAVGLAPVAAAELEGGRAAISRGRRCPEGGGVLVDGLASIGGVKCPEVSLLVAAVEGAGPAACCCSGASVFRPAPFKRRNRFSPSGSVLRPEARGVPASAAAAPLYSRRGWPRDACLLA